MRRRLSTPLLLAGTLAATVAIRIPSLLAARQISFDEGVYGASVIAMRDGAAPFREIFSSQGPLFLPVLWLFDVAGLRHVRAIRLAMIAAALAVTIGTYLLARRVGSRGTATLAALVIGTSSTFLAAAGPVQSDGVALAFAVWAVVIAMEPEDGRLHRYRPLTVGVLMGAAVAVKTVFAAPAGLAVAWLFIARRRAKRLLAATGVGVLVVLAASLPWGLGNVWEQVVSFHLGVPRRRDPIFALRRIGETLLAGEAPLLLMAAGGVGFAAVAWRTAAARLHDRRVEATALMIWLAATVVLLTVVVGFGHGYERYASFLVPPLVATVAMIRPPVWLVTAAVLAGAPIHYVANHDQIWPPEDVAIAEEEAITSLRALPAGAEAITDDPGLAWLAERHPPPPLVDPSWARVRSHDLTTGDVLAAAADPDVCAVLFLTKRFDFMDPDLGDALDGYTLYEDWGSGRRLYLKDACRPADHGQRIETR